MIRTPKRNVHLRLPQTERPDARAFLAEARRHRQAAPRTEPDLAALIARRHGEKQKEREL